MIIDIEQQHQALKSHAFLTRFRENLPEELREVTLAMSLALVRATLLEGTDVRIADIATGPDNPYVSEEEPAWVRRAQAMRLLAPLTGTEFQPAIPQTFSASYSLQHIREAMMPTLGIPQVFWDDNTEDSDG